MKTKYEVSNASIKRFYAKYLDKGMPSGYSLIKFIDQWKKDENFSKYSKPINELVLYAHQEKIPSLAFALGYAMAEYIHALENDKRNVLGAIDTLLTFHNENS